MHGIDFEIHLLFISRLSCSKMLNWICSVRTQKYAVHCLTDCTSARMNGVEKCTIYGHCTLYNINKSEGAARVSTDQQPSWSDYEQRVFTLHTKMLFGAVCIWWLPWATECGTPQPRPDPASFFMTTCKMKMVIINNVYRWIIAHIIKGKREKVSTDGF